MTDPYTCLPGNTIVAGNVADIGKLQFNSALGTAPLSITVYGGPSSSEEMLRISPEGFWVRGQLVPQDHNEAAAVYKAVQQWATWRILSQP